MARRPILKPFFTGAFLATLVCALLPRDHEADASPLAIDRMHFASARYASVFPRYLGAPPILGGFGGGGGAVISANMPDPYVVPSTPWDVTGDIDASGYVQAADIKIGQDHSEMITARSGAGANARLHVPSSTTGVVELRGGGTDSGTAIAVRISANADYTTAGAKLLSVGDNAGTSYAEKFYVDLGGSIGALGNIDLTTAGAFIRFNAQGYIEDTGNDINVNSSANVRLTPAAGSNIVSTGATGSGGTINGVEIDYSTADTLATDTTPVSVTGISLAIDANDTYAIICQGTVFTALATAGPQVGLDLPASATQVATCAIGTTASAVANLSFTADDGVCANTTGGLTTPGTPFTLYSKVTNSTNAGNVVLRIRSETTDDVSVVAGARCEAKKIVDS